MDGAMWLKILQLAIPAVGLLLVMLTLQQKINSDNRAEWWKRFTWAVENIGNDNATDEVREAASIEIEELLNSKLAGKTESYLIDNLSNDADGDSIEEKDGEE